MEGSQISIDLLASCHGRLCQGDSPVLLRTGSDQVQQELQDNQHNQDSEGNLEFALVAFLLACILLDELLVRLDFFVPHAQFIYYTANQ